MLSSSKMRRSRRSLSPAHIENEWLPATLTLSPPAVWTYKENRMHDRNIYMYAFYYYLELLLLITIYIFILWFYFVWNLYFLYIDIFKIFKIISMYL